MSKLFVDEIVHQSSQGSGTITLGASGETITTASGAKFSGITGQNYPAFEAYVSTSSTSITNNTQTKVQADTESFDTDSCYDNSTNYRFTPNVAGKYFVYAQVKCKGSAVSRLAQAKSYIKKNGSVHTIGEHQFHNNYAFISMPVAVAIVDMNGSSDYLEMFTVIDDTSSSPVYLGGSDRITKFGAYRIGS